MHRGAGRGSHRGAAPSQEHTQSARRKPSRTARTACTSGSGALSSGTAARPPRLSCTSGDLQGHPHFSPQSHRFGNSLEGLGFRRCYTYNRSFITPERCQPEPARVRALGRPWRSPDRGLSGPQAHVPSCCQHAAALSPASPGCSPGFQG